MDFTSLGFCLFLAVSLCVYHSMKTPKARLIALALANAAFFLLSGAYFAVCCCAVLIAAYAMGIAVSGMQKNRSAAGWLAAASLLPLSAAGTGGSGAALRHRLQNLSGAQNHG